MDRRLVLMRHAKSSWDDPELADHDRPLNKRGRRDAPRIAAALAKLGFSPDVVLCSDARRTRETWERMAAEFAAPPEQVTFANRLYGASASEIQDMVEELPDRFRAALVIAHNPGISEALARIAGVQESMTTANAAWLEGEGPSWRAFCDGSVRLVHLLRPRELEEK